MKDRDLWEGQMQSWTPRGPSPKVGRRLFGVADTASLDALRRGIFWLTPVAACCLTMMLTFGSLNHRVGAEISEDDAIYCSGLDPTGTNPGQPVRIRQSDENVRWNVCPRLTAPVLPASPSAASPPASVTPAALLTNFIR